MNKIAESLGAVHTQKNRYNLENKLDKVIKFNLIYKKIIEKLE